MRTIPLDPDVADQAPDVTTLTRYDWEHRITYIRLLLAHFEGADWREIAKIVLHIDPERELDRARRAYDSHMARARWLSKHGYRYILRGDIPGLN